MNTNELTTTTPDLTAEEVAALPLADSVEHVFKTFEEQMTAVANEFSGLEVTSIDQLERMDEAKKAKKFCVKLRKSIEAEHKRLKAYHLEKGRKVDACKNAALAKLEPMERWLGEQATYAERMEAERRRMLHSERLAILEPFALLSLPADLSVFDDEQFAQLVADGKTVAEGRIREEEEMRQREAARLAEERRVREENERLRKENEEAQALIRKQERIKEVELATQRAEADRKLLAEQQKAQAEREHAKVLADAAAKEAAEAIRKEKEKAAAAQKLVDDAAAEQRRKDEEARVAAEAAAKAPDKAKCARLAEQIGNLGDGFRLSDLKMEEAVMSLLAQVQRDILAWAQ